MSTADRALAPDDDAIIGEYADTLAQLEALHASAEIARSAASRAGGAPAPGAPATRAALRRSAESALRLTDRYAGWARIASIFLGRLARERALIEQLVADNRKRAALARGLVEAAGGALDALPAAELPDARRAVRELALLLDGWLVDVESWLDSFIASRATSTAPAPKADPPNARALAGAAERRQRRVLGSQADVRRAVQRAFEALGAAHTAIPAHDHARRAALRDYRALLARAAARLPASAAESQAATAAVRADARAAAAKAAKAAAASARAPARGALAATAAPTAALAAAQRLEALRRFDALCADAAAPARAATAAAAAAAAAEGAAATVVPPMAWLARLSELDKLSSAHLAAALALPSAPASTAGAGAAEPGAPGSAAMLMARLGAAGVEGVRAETQLGEAWARARVARAAAEAVALARAAPSQVPPSAAFENAETVGADAWAAAFAGPASAGLRAALGLAALAADGVGAARDAAALSIGEAEATELFAACAFETAPATAAGGDAAEAKAEARRPAPAAARLSVDALAACAAHIVRSALEAETLKILHRLLAGGARAQPPPPPAAAATTAAAAGAAPAVGRPAWDWQQAPAAEPNAALLVDGLGAPLAAAAPYALQLSARLPFPPLLRARPTAANAPAAPTAAASAGAPPAAAASGAIRTLEALAERVAEAHADSRAAELVLTLLEISLAPGAPAGELVVEVWADALPAALPPSAAATAAAALPPTGSRGALARSRPLASSEVRAALGAAAGAPRPLALRHEANAADATNGVARLTTRAPPAAAVSAAAVAADAAAAALRVRLRSGLARGVADPAASSLALVLVYRPAAAAAAGGKGGEKKAAVVGGVKLPTTIAFELPGTKSAAAAAAAAQTPPPTTAPTAGASAGAEPPSRGAAADAGGEGVVIGSGALSLASLCAPDHPDCLERSSIVEVELRAPIGAGGGGGGGAAHGEAGALLGTVTVELGPLAALLRCAPAVALARAAPPPPPPAGAKAGGGGGGAAAAAVRAGPRNIAIEAAAVVRAAMRAASAARLMQRWMRAHARRDDFYAVRSVPGGREAFAAALAAAEATPSLHPAERAAASLRALSAALAAPDAVGARLAPAAMSLQLQLSAAAYANGAAGASARAASPSRARGGGGGGGGGARPSSAGALSAGSALGGAYTTTLSPPAPPPPPPNDEGSERLLALVRSSAHALGLVEAELSEARLDGASQALEARRLRDLLAKCHASQAALSALALTAPGEDGSADLARVRALAAVGALRGENEALMAALGQWVDENARMRARLHDVHAAAATPAAKPGSLAGGAGASMRAGGANAQQREIAALTAALRSARDAERIARKAATDAAGHAAVQFGTLEQSLSDKTAALRRAKLEIGKLSRELEEIKARERAFLLRATGAVE